MHVYRDILESLVIAGRRPIPLLEQIERKVCLNLGMEYEVETMMDILVSFVALKFGSTKLFQDLQEVICKGHAFTMREWLPNKVLLPYSGKSVSTLVESYAEVLGEFQDFELSPDFKWVVKKMILNKNASFTLEEIMNVYEALPAFAYEEQKEIETHLITCCYKATYHSAETI